MAVSDQQAMNQIQLEEHIRNLAYSGEDFEALTAELKRLEASGTDPESIAFVRRKVDEYLVDYQLGEQARSKELNKIYQGITLFVLGIGVYGYAQSRGYGAIAINYGLMLTGLVRSWSGYKSWQRPVESFIPMKARFKRKA